MHVPPRVGVFSPTPTPGQNYRLPATPTPHPWPQGTSYQRDQCGAVINVINVVHQL